MEKEIEVSEDIKALANIFKCKGSLFLVGGYVRNSIIGIKTNDIDLASSVKPSEVIELLEGTEYTVKERSKKAGVVEITSPNGEIYEHATFRVEKYKEDSGEHMPIEVEFTTDIREDAKRRDFTINSIYYDILRKRIVDIYSGIYDIEKKIIKCIETPESVFNNDGERILRMIRFASELNFKIDRTTWCMAKRMSYRLNDICGTRKYEQLAKILESSQKYKISKPKGYIKGLKALNIFHAWASMYVPVTKVKYDMVKKVPADNRLIGLLIDIIEAVNPDGVEYYLRYLLGNRGYSFSIKKIDYIVNIICGYFDALNRIGNKKYFSRYYTNFGEIGKLINAKSKSLFIKYNFFYRYIRNHKLPVVIQDLKIGKQDIAQKFAKIPERKHKKILLDLLSKVYEGELENTKEALMKEIKDNVISGNY